MTMYFKKDLGEERINAMGQERPSPDEFRIYQPWSNFVLHTRLPDPILQRLTEITDEVLANPRPETLMGERLAGQMDEEYEINDEIGKEEEINRYFLRCVEQYIGQSRRQCHPLTETQALSEEKFRVAMRSFWINKQLPGDYNPMHTHSNCDLSAVCYIKIPDKTPPKKKHTIFTQMRDPDGAIVFVNNTGSDDTFAEGILEYSPKVGDYFLFAAKQYHSVHPYRSENPNAERRSVAMNFAVDMVETQLPDWERQQLKEDMKIPKSQSGFPYNLIVPRVVDQVRRS